jgi:hypothetical protein
LYEQNAAFYEVDGLRRLAAQLHHGGVFALWSDDPPDHDFLENLRQSFTEADARTVSFFHPLLEQNSSSTVYIASRA